MELYKIKPEYLSLWSNIVTENTMISGAEVRGLSRAWDKPVEELLEQMQEVEFEAVSEAEIRQEDDPPVAYKAIDAILKGEKPAEDGCMDLFELVWFDCDAEADFDNPDEVRISEYGWDPIEKHKV